MGYNFLGILEVYEYDVTKYDPYTREGGIFADYINTFLKNKPEASGYPEKEEQYVENFYAREGVWFDSDSLIPNSAKRGLAKVCLNSFWVKLVEWKNRTQTKMVSDPHELYRFLSTPLVEVVNLLFGSDSVVWASWRYIAEEKVPSVHHTNEVIHEFVECGGLMHLYARLHKLGERALYCDTDCLICVQNDGEPMVQCGDALGDMTSELKEKEYISEFVSGGRTNYAYKICNSVTVELKRYYSQL